MWEAFFLMLSKGFDAAKSIFGSSPAPTEPTEPDPVDAAAARAGTVAGGAAYEAGKHAGPSKPK